MVNKKQTRNKLKMSISQEERDRRRQRIYQIKPWEKSTGAKSELGKLIVSQNALKHGLYSKNTLTQAIAREERENELLEIFREQIRRIIEVKS